MLQVPGRITSRDVVNIDNNYQMIDAHIDEAMSKQIINLEFIDLSKLLPRSRVWDDDQRLEIINKNGQIINKNGQTYLSPVSDREAVQINSYMHWGQAFHVYCHVLTAHYPDMSSELLQYNHTIHTASTAYIWENIYAYDREFRQHISRHPEHVWNVILQQAWTMILKDRLRHDSGGGHQHKNKRDAEPCKRFNKGHCTYRLSCKFDHSCSLKKCGKFGHGAHQCHLRDTNNHPVANNSNNGGGQATDGQRKES